MTPLSQTTPARYREKLKHFWALSRTPHGIIDMTTPCMAALLWLGEFPALGTIIVSKVTAPAGDPATFTFTGDAAGTHHGRATPATRRAHHDARSKPGAFARVVAQGEPRPCHTAAGHDARDVHERRIPARGLGTGDRAGMKPSSELQRAAEEAARNEERLHRWRVRYAHYQHRRSKACNANCSTSYARARARTARRSGTGTAS